ncbi:MAG: HAD family phosphatase [Ruminococcaceae bacterium]|nr:HAD family phosphatase [Oscillospiraceae bacterium]
MSHAVCIFDFDGTLVDSMPSWSEKMLNILRASGVDYPDDIIRIITPLGDGGSADYFRDVLGVKMSREEMFARMDAYALPCYRDKIPAKAGVEAYLRRLHAEGVKLCILTASPHKMLDPCLARLGLTPLFTQICSSDDFGMPKSDPAIYLALLDRLGVSAADAVFFDDNLCAIETAAKAGLCTVGVYDPTGESFADELRAAADHYLHSFEGAPLF